MKRELRVLQGNLLENVVYSCRTRSGVGYISAKKHVPVRIGEKYQAVIPAWSPGQEATCRYDTWIDVERELKMGVYSKESNNVETSTSP